MAHLSPTAIFSPSVARQQLAAAKEWSYVDSWLSSKYHPKTPPQFERTAETLKALLALASHNEAADEECDLLGKVEGKAVQELKESEATDPHAEILDTLEDSLTKEGQMSLDTLASTSVLLNMPAENTEDLARKIIDLQTTSFSLNQATDRVAALQGYLDRETERLGHFIDELQSEAFEAPAGIAKETLDTQRKSKGIASKLPTLQKQISTLTAASGTPKPTIQDVQAEEEKFTELQGMIEELDSQVKSYHSLPHDMDLARLEVEGLKVELKELTRKRDMMFEGLVERESPRKGY